MPKNTAIYLMVETADQMVLIQFSDAGEARDWEDANEMDINGTVRGLARVVPQHEALLP